MQRLHHEVARYLTIGNIYEWSSGERLNGSKSIQSKSIENMTVFILELMKFYFTDSLKKPKLIQ